MRARAPAPARACTPHSAAAARAAETAILEQASPAGAGAAFPIVRARNVYVLPGVPELLRRKWQARPCPGGWSGAPKLLHRKWQPCPCLGG